MKHCESDLCAALIVLIHSFIHVHKDIVNSGVSPTSCRVICEIPFKRVKSPLGFNARFHLAAAVSDFYSMSIIASLEVIFSD